MIAWVDWETDNWYTSVTYGIAAYRAQHGVARFNSRVRDGL